MSGMDFLTARQEKLIVDDDRGNTKRCLLYKLFQWEPTSFDSDYGKELHDL